jgi:D-beta-D-heptose 7-phosphate kinase/D-beta-D-heptose 1-phosphate adenosyltransferase
MADHIQYKRLQKAIGRFAQARVLVLGDIMLDQFIWGSVSRISPEAPVPVVQVESETYMLGGAANVLHNLIALGGRANLGGLVGDDEAGRHVIELLDQLKVDHEGVVVCDDRPTTVKTRVVAHSQQVVRVDRESKRPVARKDMGRLLSYLEAQIKDVDAVVVSDYAKGVVTSRLMGHLRKGARAHGRIVNVDPKVTNMALYQGATVVTPNHMEAANAVRIAAEGEDYVVRAGRLLLKKLQARCVLITQGERGMTMFCDDGETHIPTTAKRVYDVTGAGDTVISTLTLGLVAGLSPAEAAVMANFAAGVVVGEVGTSAVTAGHLAQAVEEGARSLSERHFYLG